MDKTSEPPSELYKKGDKVRAVVSRVDIENGAIRLGIKQLDQILGQISTSHLASELSMMLKSLKSQILVCLLNST